MMITKNLMIGLVSVIGCLPGFAAATTEQSPVVQAEAFFTIQPVQGEGAAAQDFTARLMSQRFVFANLKIGAIIVQEAVELAESTLSEIHDGRVTVTAYKAKSAADATPLWQFSANGRGGDFLFGEYDYQVYRLRQASCCDMSTREVYYDLHTGAPLLSTTTPALAVADSSSRTYRYIGYDDGAGSETPPEMQADQTISGILAYAGSRIPTQKLAIIADPDKEYRQQEFTISLNGKPLSAAHNVVDLQTQEASFADELVLRVQLRCRCETDEFLEIPLVNDAFVLERAVVSPGIKLKALPAGDKPAFVGSGHTAFTDPFAYCDWVGVADEPDALYTGAPMPDAILKGIRAAADLGDLPQELLTQGTVWRCMDGKVWACFVGANLPCLAKADLKRTPTPEMLEFCQADPAAEVIPSVVTGRETVYEWRCTNGVPEIVRDVFTPDAQGFLAEIWYALSPQ